MNYDHMVNVHVAHGQCSWSTCQCLWSPWSVFIVLKPELQQKICFLYIFTEKSKEIIPKSLGAAYNLVRLINGILR